MKRIKIYKNSGCLASEKRIIYTYGSPAETAVCWDEIEAEIPEGWEIAESICGDVICISPDRYTYLINDILAGNDCPCFRFYDGKSNHITRLTVIG